MGEANSNTTTTKGVLEVFSDDEVHVDEMGEDVHCDECNIQIEDWVFIGGDRNYCKQCYMEIKTQLEKEAAEFAQANCKITSSFDRFDKSREYRCSRDDYELGDKDSHTENSVRCFNRHNCTNYDELLGQLDRYSLRGMVFYDTIRDRIEELIDDEMERMEESISRPS